MNSAVLGEIAQAVNTIYDASATNSQRQLAQNFCETLKDNPQSPLWGHYLAHKQNSQPDILRHFGLSLIENAVRFKWNDGSYSDQDRAGLRDAVVDLVTNGTHEIFVERTYIKEKVSRLFVEVAKRMWPIQWPHMDILLRELYAQNPTTRELCLLIYRSLAEDVFLYDDVVAELRKQELVTGMMAVTVSAHILEDLHAKRGADVNLRSEGTQQPTDSGRTDFEMLLRLIRANPENEGWLNRWVGGAADLHQEWIVQRAGNAEQAPVTERLAVLTLNTLVVYLDWVLLRAIGESRVAYLLTELLLSASLPIRQSAAECLIVLFSRNIHYADTENRLSCIWTPIFSDGNLEKMITAWARVHGQTDAGGIDSVEQTSLVEEEDYKFMKRLAQGATALGENQICFRKAAEAPPNFTRYLEFMMVIFDHPSILVASTTASLWGELVKHDYFKSTQEILFSLPRLLTLIATRVCHDRTHEDAVNHYRHIDFDSADEFETFSGAFRQRMLDIVRSVANLKPKDSFSYIAERVRQMLVLQPNSAYTNDLGFQKDDSPYVQLFEGNCAMLEIIVVGSLKSSEGLDEGFWRFMMELVELILNFKTADPTLARIQLQMIVAFGGVLHLAPPLLLQCLEKIFTFVAFTMPGEEDFIRRKISICEATRVLRRKAASLLVKLAMTMPDALIGIYASISPAIQRLSDERLVLMSEETILKEFLLAIVYFSSTPLVEKAPAFTSLVEPTVRALEDKANVDLTSPSQLMEFMGAPLLASNVQNIQISPGQLQVANPGLVDAFAIKKEQRGQLLGLLSGMSQYLKLTIETKPSGGGNKRVELWADYIPRILRSVLTIIKSIHGLWDPSVWQQFPSDVLRVLATTPQERALFAGTDVSDDLLAVGANEFMNQVTMMSRWLGSIRDQCYHILSRLTYASPNFYTVPSIGQHLLQSLLSDAMHIDNRHWKLILNNVMRPLSLNCPSGFDSTILEPILSPFLRSMVSKLDREWRDLVERGIRLTNEEAEEATDMSDDIIAEKMLRDVTRAYIDLIAALLAPATPAAKKTEENPANILKQSFQNPDLVRFLLWDEAISGPLLSSITHLVTYKDTQTSRKAAVTSSKLLPVLVGHYEFHVWLGKDLLMSLLEALHDPYHQEIHSDIISTIADVYIRLRPVSMLPYETFGSLPGMNVDSLKAFEESLAKKSSAKEQNAIVKGFLQSITGIAISQQGKKQESFVLNIPEKQLLTRQPRQSRDEDREGDAANEWFSGLFDQGSR